MSSSVGSHTHTGPSTTALIVRPRVGLDPASTAVEEQGSFLGELVTAVALGGLAGLGMSDGKSSSRITASRDTENWTAAVIGAAVGALAVSAKYCLAAVIASGTEPPAPSRPLSLDVVTVHTAMTEEEALALFKLTKEEIAAAPGLLRETYERLLKKLEPMQKKLAAPMAAEIAKMRGNYSLAYSVLNKPSNS